MGVRMVRCGGEEEVEGADRPQKSGQAREYYKIGERRRVREQKERQGECRDSHKQCAQMMHPDNGGVDRFRLKVLKLFPSTVQISSWPSEV